MASFTPSIPPMSLYFEWPLAAANPTANVASVLTKLMAISLKYSPEAKIGPSEDCHEQSPEESCGRPVSRILYLFPGDDHSSCPAVANRVWLPTRVSGPKLPTGETPIRHCSRWGLPCRTLLPSPRCALTAPFHLYPALAGQSVLCGAIPRVSPAGRYPAPLLRGVRTFLAHARPSSRPQDVT